MTIDLLRFYIMPYCYMNHHAKFEVNLSCKVDGCLMIKISVSTEPIGICI